MRSKQKISKSSVSVSGCLFWEYCYASLSVCLQCCQVFQASTYRKVLNKDVNNRWHFSINPKLLTVFCHLDTPIQPIQPSSGPPNLHRLLPARFPAHIQHFIFQNLQKYFHCLYLGCFSCFPNTTNMQ